MSRRLPILLSCALALASASSCKTVSDEAKQDLAEPVDCSTAKQDIAALEAEKASVAKQVAAGARMVLPVALVGGLLQRDLGNRKQVATGEYNDMIERKISEIQRECEL